VRGGLNRQTRNPLKKPAPDSWYAFHFGSQYVNSSEFNPPLLQENSKQDCYVMMADLCSFTAFFQATPGFDIIERMMTSFYTQIRKTVHHHRGMLDKIVGDAVIAVWGLHHREKELLPMALAAARELVTIARTVSDEWQSHIDRMVEPKGLKVGLSKGPILLIPRDVTYPGLSLLGNPLNLAARLQIAAQANQLVCSNQVYQDVVRLKLDHSFQPFKSSETDGYIEAKNLGPIKAWVTDLT
jgi:class 3 adenylate cyclase